MRVQTFIRLTIPASILLLISFCAQIEEEQIESNTANSTSSSLNPPSPVANNAPAGCESFHYHFSNNLSSNRKFYADEAVSPAGSLGTEFGDPAKATNGAGGFSDVYSLRDHTGNLSGELILKWSSDTVCNGEGTDFVIFENAFFISGGNGEVNIEPGVVSVSENGTDWATFPHDYLGKDTNDDGTPDSETASPASVHYGHWTGFTGLYPAFYNESTHSYVKHSADPFRAPDRALNYAGTITGFGGGDHFDLDDLPNNLIANNIKTNGFRYIRITRATKIENPDAAGNNFPVVSNTFDLGAPDIDAIYARYLKADAAP